MWHELKMVPLVQLGLSPAQLHVIAGLVLYGLALAITRRSLLALALTTAGQFANEVLDLGDDLSSATAIDGIEILTDTIATLALPVAATFSIWLLRRR
jgi:hypothetical protein